MRTGCSGAPIRLDLDSMNPTGIDPSLYQDLSIMPRPVRFAALDRASVFLNVLPVPTPRNPTATSRNYRAGF